MKNKSTLLKDAIILFIITLIAGCALGFGQEITKEPIAKAEKEEKQVAYQKVFKNADKFEEDSAIKEKVDKSETFLKENDLSGAKIEEVTVAQDASGQPVGYVISFLATEGYGGDISLVMGMTNEGEITGFEVLKASETPGLGMRCEEPEFKNQFAGKKADSLVYTKDGAKADNEIDALSGATITTKAVTKGVNTAIAFLKQDIMQG
ncbi:RnfABCDGE type electron transport complex subunit G [[Clostridium] polysaccharolyticum]|uniref:Ion-translocating oxidoreductase complex subunit G n=1 Tax=[Clostridium] polysaccharolyticum TaxID=29364 RepID=A0A1I0BTD1_9FIRM|nr:RnfABCDGE type electron transport complex subunit G [[Clostridium] polysaccharolyticum]SET10352.1 electron transport complex protein RnfG [[Clostridium] polysaccharolyticum]